ncbi:MAG: CAP domain-containing protein [bacterium]|nr:CAP domain-containing protein [bacterium]
MKRLHKWLKKYFVPHTENDFKPHFLRHESFLFLLLLIIIIETGFLVQVFVVFDKTKFLAAVLPGALESITNEERAQNNSAPLTTNKLLQKAAQLKAEDMATRGYFAHTSPDGKTPWYWLDQVGYRYTYAGENLAVNFFESEDVSKAWMNSPSHRTNIVKKNYTEIGIGVANGKYEGKRTVFVAQFFGTPAFASKIEVTPQKTSTSLVIKTPTIITPIPKTPTTPLQPSSVEILGEETTSVKVLEKITQGVKNKSSEKFSIRSYLEKTLASPRRSMNYVYMGIAFLVILTLLLVAFIASELRHPLVVARGVGLIAIIILLSFINRNTLNLEPAVPLGDVGANAIEVLLK